jgi:hypothetical protein
MQAWKKRTLGKVQMKVSVVWWWTKKVRRQDVQMDIHDTLIFFSVLEVILAESKDRKIVFGDNCFVTQQNRSSFKFKRFSYINKVRTRAVLRFAAPTTFEQNQTTIKE